MKTIDLTNETIRRAAIDRLGCADANVVSYVDRQIYVGVEGEQFTDCCGGAWFVLSVQPQPGDAFEVIARRRSTAELVELIGQRRRLKRAA